MLASPRLILPSIRFASRPQSFRPKPLVFRSFLATMATDTSKYKFNHSMCVLNRSLRCAHNNHYLFPSQLKRIRVKDPKESIKFYEFLGMKLLDKLENPDAKFDLYFLGYDSPGAVSHGKHRSDREGLIELTHNYGTENDPEYKIMNGNTEPYRGFGHTCISVDNIQAACARLEGAGYRFQKKLTDGRMRHIAFALDPDNYWVEIISFNPIDSTVDVKETSVETYRMNHTMIRVKDPEKSLAFYKDVMGMKVKVLFPRSSLLMGALSSIFFLFQRVLENKDAKFNLYFLGYGPDAPDSSPNGTNPVADREGLLELTWNYGTENDPAFKYHNGNDQPQGFGHIAVSVDDINAACARFEDMNVSWKKRLTDGRMKNIAFVLDPDNYWVEIIQNESMKK
ncbi:putative lactoylglutathione lyase protein [Mycena sanguinolenta]|uniref:Lactoylglutathione lyase n=1 Tax=Mycena sanguinolenta TaxID=230812 RepID=A0A8H7D452_9AGAR|nr:putative lactoylglutathione lyase protein [Mycena sanguinolenta]